METLECPADQVDIGKGANGLEKPQLVLRMRDAGVDQRAKTGSAHRHFGRGARNLDRGENELGRLRHLPYGRLKDQRSQRRILQRHGLHGGAERGFVGNRVGRFAKGLCLAQQRPVAQSQHHCWEMVACIVTPELGGETPRAFGIGLPLSKPSLHTPKNFGHGRFDVGSNQRTVAQLFGHKDVAAEVTRHPDPNGLGLVGIHRSGEILDNRFMHKNRIDEAAEGP
jgi:hypothetical protein